MTTPLNPKPSSAAQTLEEIAREALDGWNFDESKGRAITSLSRSDQRLYGIILAAITAGVALQEKEWASEEKEEPSDSGQAVLQKILPLLAVTGERLRTQDNRCTSNPMFCVQEKVTIYGMDPRWSDDIVWIEIDEGVREIKPPRNRRETDRVQKSAKKSYWHTVMAAFTEEGCKEYLALNGHNHRGETRIYVESWNRCPEMVAIRSALLEAPSVSEGGGEHAVSVLSPTPSPSSTPQAVGRGEG